MNLPRDVRPTDRFQRELEKIEPNIRRTDEALRYVEELLASDPEVGLETEQPRVRIAPILFPRGIVGDTIEVSIYYTWSDELVELLSIRIDI